LKFKSKKGIVHGLLYWGSVLITAGIAYYSGALWVWIIPALLAFFSGGSGLAPITCWRTRCWWWKYGPASERIPYHLITRVAPCHNMKSSAALSLDRLEVKHGGGLIAHSYTFPKDQTVNLWRSYKIRGRLRGRNYNRKNDRKGERKERTTPKYGTLQTK